MIRVTCPGCKQVHDFLELYIGLTIVCKHCRQGILVPPVSEEGLPPLEAPAPAVAPGEMATFPLAPPAPDNGAITALDRRDPVKTPRAKAARAAEPDDLAGDPAARKRLRILLGVLAAILVVGGILVAGVLWKKFAATDTPLVVNGDKDDKKNDENGSGAPMDKDKDAKAKEKAKKKPKSDEPDVAIVEWYTAKELPGPTPEMKLELTEADVKRGCVFVVAKVKLSAEACAEMDEAKGWTINVKAKDFTVYDDIDRKWPALGLHAKDGFGSSDGKNYTVETSITTPSKEEPEFCVQTVFFTITEAAMKLGDLRLRYQSYREAVLTAAKQRTK